MVTARSALAGEPALGLVHSVTAPSVMQEAGGRAEEVLEGKAAGRTLPPLPPPSCEPPEPKKGEPGEAREGAAAPDDAPQAGIEAEESLRRSDQLTQPKSSSGRLPSRGPEAGFRCSNSGDGTVSNVGIF